LRARRLLALIVAAAWAGIAAWHVNKPLPAGTHVASPVCTVNAQELRFIADITAADGFGRPVVSQGIFDEELRIVRQARRFIVLDYSRFGAAPALGAPQRRIAAELTDALLVQRRERPQLKVLLLIDPVNERYGATRLPELQLLRAAGVEVVPVRLDALRDSNPLYSGLWRLALRWWDAPRFPLGVATRRLNFKADERKLLIADDGRGALVAVVSSANPLDEQTGWSNAGARVAGAALAPLLGSELELARLSGWRARADGDPFAPAQPPQCASDPGETAGAGSSARVQVLTEGAIRAVLLERLDGARRGDGIDVAMFHLADHAVAEALLAAARRGVAVRLILDPNEDAKRGTLGIPNEPVASELVARSGGAIRVRWYRTHAEHFHDSLVMIYDRERLWLTLGSGNLTRRSLDDYNLEANVAIEVARSAALASQALEYFDSLWSNRAALGIEYTADFAVYADPSQSHYWLARLMEGAGLSTF
jgi:phosphatidylserine/phosphatidylglycerophosphate/cardiolipin synthase-like enzyme